MGESGSNVHSAANRQSTVREVAVVKHVTTNIARNRKEKQSLKFRRKPANLNRDYRDALIGQTAPIA